MEHASGAARLQIVEEADAVGEVAKIYHEVEQAYRLPFVPTMSKALGVSAAALGICWAMGGD